MTLRMGDAINPVNLPAGLDAYAGYNDGRWPSYQAIARAHPTSFLLELTVYLANSGQGLDMEPLDATVDQFPTYYGWRTAAGVWRPVGYASISSMKDVVYYATRAGISRPNYRLWSAHYGLGKHICGPTTCGNVQCDGTQWINHGGWDESLLMDNFFGPPAPAPIQPGGKMLTNCVGIAPTPSGLGYWEVQADGAVYTHGDAKYLGGTNTLKPPRNNPIVGIGAHPTAMGYWLVGADGGVFSYGVPFYGSLGSKPLAAPIVDIEVTKTGNGYILVGKDGGVFTFGDAKFEGSGA